MEGRRAALVLFATLACLVAASAGYGPAGAESPSVSPEGSLIHPMDDETGLWPYTSRAPSTNGRTLPLNVFVPSGGEATHRALTTSPNAEWNRTTVNESDAEGPAQIAHGLGWDTATGASRYTYVEGPHGEGRWTTSDYQVHSGNYLGTRHHVRAYVAPSGEWTALQVHEEYWDWFRLRHTVTGVASPANSLTAELHSHPAVNAFREPDFGPQEGSNNVESDVNVFTLSLGAVGVVGAVTTVGAAASNLRRHAVAILGDLGGFSPVVKLVGGLFLLFLGVRGAGIALESAIPAVPPTVWAALLYPVIALGLPFAASRLARPLPPWPAFGLTMFGLGVAFVVDFASLGVNTLPDPLVYHRLGLLAALGLVAAGSARANDARYVRLTGFLAWGVGLVLPLADAI